MRFSILLLLLLPLAELWVMLVIGSEVGALAVILWLVAMIFLGVNLLRYLGASSMLRAAQTVRSGGDMPGRALVGSLFKALGAVLLIVPGFITDFIALLCFIPLVRHLLLKRWMAKIVASVNAKGFTMTGFEDGSAKHEPFGSARGNIYEHQGTPQKKDDDETTSGLLIDQQPDTSTSKTPKND